MNNTIAWVKTALSELNLFKTGSENVEVVQGERRATRLYLSLLTASIIILTFYYSVIPFDETITLPSPALAEYSELARRWSLECPCSKISVKYKEFVNVEPIYHELCRSDFVSDQWMAKMSVHYNRSWNNSEITDWRRIGLFQFQTLRLLCELSKENVVDGLQLFQEKNYIQAKLATADLFSTQIDSFLNEFIASSSATYGRILQFVQNISAQSLIMTGGPMTSVIPINQFSLASGGANMPFAGNDYTFPDGTRCVCTGATATTCVGPSIFEQQTMPGFLTGCYMMNALFKSSLEPLYNQSFINILTNSTNTFRKLNSSNSHITVDTLLINMFVDRWPTVKSYERYFNQCRPELCRYSVRHRYGFFQIITLIIGLFGGLSASLRIFAPIFVNSIWPVIVRFITRNRMHLRQVEVSQTLGGNVQKMQTLSKM